MAYFYYEVILYNSTSEEIRQEIVLIAKIFFLHFLREQNFYNLMENIQLYDGLTSF